MIDIILSKRSKEKLRRELRRAGTNEIGGVLAGEHVADGTFVVSDLSVQRDGSFASFTRSAPGHRRFMRRFFELKGHNYQRFNYLGEWHSHPCFVPTPSPPDVIQMQRLIEAPDQTAPFLTLLVVKLEKDGGLEGSAHAFRRRTPYIRVRLGAEGGGVMDFKATTAAEVRSSWRLQYERHGVFRRGKR